MPRPKVLPENTVALYLRVPTQLVEHLDSWVSDIRGTTIGGSGITRTDLIRDILGKAVEEHERERKTKKR